MNEFEWYDYFAILFFAAMFFAGWWVLKNEEDSEETGDDTRPAELMRDYFKLGKGDK